MTINRYDKPVENLYISQYVPIPFELLYKLGSTYNALFDKANAELASNIKTWRDFKSPSAVDTLRYYDLTMGKITPFVDKMSKNMDLLKTAEGRAEMSSIINNMPYEEISKLQLSRDALLKRQEVNMNLMQQGKYNPLWHDVDYGNYDTSRQGIYNDLSPLAYKSEVDLVTPYVKPLKSSFIETKGGYDWSGVSEDRIDYELEKNKSAIYNTPEALKHLEILRNQGYDEATAMKIFEDRINTAGRAFAYRNPEANKFALMELEYATKARYAKNAAKQAQENAEKERSYLTQHFEATGDAKNINMMSKRMRENPLWLDANTNYWLAKTPEDRAKALQLRNSIEDQFQNNFSVKDAFNPYFKSKGAKLNQTQLNKAVAEIYNDYGIRPQEYVDSIFDKSIPGKTVKTEDFGNAKVIYNSQGLRYTGAYLATLGGYKPTQGNAALIVDDALSSGELNNLVVVQNGNGFSLPNGRGGHSNSKTVYVAVSMNDVKSETVKQAIQKVGKPLDKEGKLESWVDEEKEVEGKPGLYKMDSTDKYYKKTNKKYYIIPVLAAMPNTDNGLTSQYTNMEALKGVTSGTEVGKAYEDVVATSFLNIK